MEAPQTCRTVRLRPPHGDTIEIRVELGENLRVCLLRANRTPYRGKFVQLNCRGLGICGSCQVLVLEKGQWWRRRSCQIRCFHDMEIQLQ